MPESQDVSREPPAHLPQLRGWVTPLPFTGSPAQPLTSPPGVPHWDRGIHSAQVRSGWTEGCARTPHLAEPILPKCQLLVLRLTCLLPACQLSCWDLSSHFPLGKWVEVGGSGGSSMGGGVPDLQLREREPRRRGRWTAEPPSAGESQGPQSCQRQRKSLDSTCGGGLSGPTEHSRLR